MKKAITLIALVFLVTNVPALAQVPAETWNFQGYSIGQGASGQAYTSECFMPEIARVGSQYIMYYSSRYSNTSAISYATSSDMLTWAVQDTILVGSSDTANREYEVGGPSVIHLTSGQYRMFYRTSQKPSGSNPPQYHIRSAISNDGLSFTRESGVRIEVQPYQANSYFTLAGQSAMYKDAGGNVRAVITGSDTTMTPNMSSRLYAATSPDEGVTWGNFVPLYNSAHDPVVIVDSSGTYHLYCSYLMQGHRKCVSPDGVGWPATQDSIALLQNSSLLTEGSSPYMIADLGAGVTTSGTVMLFSNHKPFAPGPWENIAYYFLQPTGITPPGEQTMATVFPNPASDLIRVNTGNTNNPARFVIYNQLGELVLNEEIIQTLNIAVDRWPPGIYYYRLSAGGKMQNGKLVISR